MTNENMHLQEKPVPDSSLGGQNTRPLRTVDDSELNRRLYREGSEDSGKINRFDR
jgi:hypothetical protein